MTRLQEYEARSKAEGKAEGKIEIYFKELGYTLEQIAHKLSIPQSQVSEVLNRLGLQ